MAVTRRSSSRARDNSDDEPRPSRSQKRSNSSKKSAPTKKTTSAPATKAKSGSKTPTKKAPGQRKKIQSGTESEDDGSEESGEEVVVKSPVKKVASPTKRIITPPQIKPSSPSVKPQTIAVSPPGADHDGTSRCKSFFQRLWAGLALFSVFCFGIHLGHTVLIPAVFIVQFMMYKEMVDLSYRHLLEERDAEHIPLFRTQNWYWFVVTTFYSYARVLSIYSNIQIPHYVFISAMLFFIGFVAFVVTLRQGMYRLQFANLAWTFLSLLLFIVIETAVTISVMFQGLIWLVLPAILIMTNDTWAYIWGVLFGKTSLIQLSAKKTWEGFIGALISTPIQGWLMTRYMVPHAILICQQTKLLTFEHPQCEISSLYQLVPYHLPFTVPILGWDHILVSQMQYHAIYLSIFASLVAPFGGFFASGFKRAYAIKDFGTLIPGHGGFTDRMDCQLIMGIFVYAYYYTFVNSAPLGPEYVATALDYISNNVQIDERAVLHLYNKLDAAGQIAFKKLL